MGSTVSTVLTVLILVGVSGVAVWSGQRRRRRYEERPDTFPRGKRFALRVAPLMLVGVFVAASSAVSATWVNFGVGLAMVTVCAWLTVRALRDPGFPKGPGAKS